MRPHHDQLFNHTDDGSVLGPGPLILFSGNRGLMSMRDTMRRMRMAIDKIRRVLYGPYESKRGGMMKGRTRPPAAEPMAPKSVLK